MQFNSDLMFIFGILTYISMLHITPLPTPRRQNLQGLVLVCYWLIWVIWKSGRANKTANAKATRQIWSPKPANRHLPRWQESANQRMQHWKLETDWTKWSERKKGEWIWKKKKKMNEMWEKRKWKMEDRREAECSEYKSLHLDIILKCDSKNTPTVHFKNGP